MSSNSKDVGLTKADVAVVARVFDSAELFAGSREISILHEGALYRLSMTRLGKLILTK